MKPTGQILFTEQQYFRVAWLWWLIGACLLSAAGITIGLAIVEKEKPLQVWLAAAIVIPVEAIVVVLMYVSRLETVVTDQGVFYRWQPFQRSYFSIPVSSIEEAVLRPGPTLSYGFHWVPGFGKVHNTGPGKGIQFTLNSGRKIFIGSHKHSTFQTAIEKLMGRAKI